MPSLCVRQSFVVSISHLDLLWNYLAKWNQTLQIWCMEGSLQKYFILCYNIGQTTWIPCRGNSKLWFVKCKRKCHMKVQVQMIITNGVYESFHWDSSFRLDPAKTWLRWTIIVSDWLELLKKNLLLRNNTFFYFIYRPNNECEALCKMTPFCLDPTNKKHVNHRQILLLIGWKYSNLFARNYRSKWLVI